MKKIILACIFIITMCSTVFASDVKVQINGEIVDFKDADGDIVNAQIINDRTMVPMRKIFEVLGAIVEWDGENRIVTGIKDDKIIKLQIDNPVTSKTISGKEEEIILDVAPTIVDGRTLVPLRYIAESLEKQVGWDANQRTAIIVDYSYFTNELKQKAPALYKFLNINKEYIECAVTHNYYDLNDATKNVNMTTKINAVPKSDSQEITLTISGTNELAKDIASEGWNSTRFKLTYLDNSISLYTDNTKLREMFRLKGGSQTFSYDDLSLYGDAYASFDDFFKIWAGIKDEELNVNTFKILKEDFSKLRQMFLINNVSDEKITATSSSIRYNTYNIEYFDLAKLDNFISGNEFLKAMVSVNKLIFKNDIQKDVALYDTDNIVIKFSIENEILTVNILATNTYNEKNEYTMYFKNI